MLILLTGHKQYSKLNQFIKNFFLVYLNLNFACWVHCNSNHWQQISFIRLTEYQRIFILKLIILHWFLD